MRGARRRVLGALKLSMGVNPERNQLGPEAVRDSTRHPVVGLIPHTRANKRFKGT
jgi:hypothetical protein